MAPATTNRFPRFFTFFCVTILINVAIAMIIIYSETRQIADRYPADEKTQWLESSPPMIYYWPGDILSGDSDLILGAAITSLVAAVAGFLLAIYVEMEAVAAILGFGSLGTNMGALIHAMDLHSKYGNVPDDPRQSVYGENALYSATWTVEGWTCTLKDLLEFDDDTEDYATMCRNSRAIRVLTVFLFVFSLLLVFGMYLLYKDRKTRVTASTENVEMSVVDAPPRYNENVPPKYSKNAGPEREAA